MKPLSINRLQSLTPIFALVALVAISASTTIVSTLAGPPRGAPIPSAKEPSATPTLPSPSATPSQVDVEASGGLVPGYADPRRVSVASRGLVAGTARGSAPVIPTATVAAASTATAQPSPTPAKTATPQPTAAPTSTPLPAATPTCTPQPAAIPTQTAVPTSAGSVPSSLAVPSGADLSAVHVALGLINQSRSKNGLPALTLYEPLSQEAQAFADDMGSRGFFGHNTPEGLGPGDRMAASGLKFGRWAENIGNGYGGPTAAITQLHQLMMAEVAPNDGHKQNILNPNLHRVGVGVVTITGGRTYYVTDFID